MKKNKITKSQKRKSLVFLLIFLCFFTLIPNKTYAKGSWPDLMGNAFGAMYKTIMETIKGVQLGLAQEAALKALDQELNYLLSGKGGPVIVSDWNNFLVRRPEAMANVFINDYISQSTRGRGSLSGYVSAGSEGMGMNLNYSSQLALGARNILTDKPRVEVNYKGNPSQMFAGGNFRNMNQYFSGINNPWAFNMHMQQEYEKELQAQKLIAQTKAQSSGIIGKEVDGRTVTPASLIEAHVVKVKTMGIDIIANADNLPQVIGGVVSKAINQAMIQGIGNIQASVHKEVANVRNNMQRELNANISVQGPGAVFSKDNQYLKYR